MVLHQLSVTINSKKCGESKHHSLTTKENNMPRKAYKRTPGRSVGMPQVMEAQNFNRRISAEDALILASAGDGSKTVGFRNLLDLYQELHNIGYRCYMDLPTFMSEFIRMKVRK